MSAEMERALVGFAESVGILAEELGIARPTAERSMRMLWELMWDFHACRRGRAWGKRTRDRSWRRPGQPRCRPSRMPS